MKKKIALLTVFYSGTIIYLAFIYLFFCRTRDVRNVCLLVFLMGVIVNYTLNALNLFKQGKISETAFYAVLLFGSFGIIMTLLPFDGIKVYDLKFRIILLVMLLSCSYGLGLLDHLIPVINERIILNYTISLLFYFFQAIKNENLSSFYYFWGLIFLPFVLFTFLTAFIRKKLPPFLVVTAYIWFFLANTGLLILFFTSGPLYELFFVKTSIKISYFTAFFSGVMCSILVLNIWFLYLFLPVPAEDQGFKNRLKDLKQYIRLLIKKYNTEELKTLDSLLIIIIQSIFLLAQTYIRNAVFIFNISFVLLHYYLILSAGSAERSNGSVLKKNPIEKKIIPKHLR
ncbi:MAG: hypothetical protein A2096_11360 [Spirochaetes bacterium GWF1_41_5]|nr:MAG: hypothetical protein A2096_11360 [Spirochaetes bacterium GWF1_41_5]